MLSTVSQRPNGYPFADLEQDLGSGMQTIGGNVSSVGHAIRRLYREGDAYLKPWPIDRDAAMRWYRMDEHVAEMIRNLAEAQADSDE